jgi:hypothetical protein
MALEHEQRIGTGYLQLQLCIENPTGARSIVCERHSVTVSKD